MSVAIRGGTRGSVSARVDDIDGRPAVVITIDPTDRRGALSSVDGQSIAIAAQTALAERIPLVGYIASSGADIVEGMAALHGWGLAARALADCSGIVPIVLVVTGPAVSGPALLLGLADLVVMTADAYAFVSGPTMVTEFTGVRIDANELGGAHVHARSTGAASIVVDDVDRAREMVAALLAYLPAHADEMPPRWPTADPAERATPEAGELLPAGAAGSYDVRDVIRTIVDDDDLLELRPRWAPNLVTGSATVDGRPVGVIANQPLAIAGTLDIPASQKGAGFVSFCDSFNLPILTFVDTSGFYPGKDLEWRGMIRHGAQLAFAYARATVPRICVILRKSYGGAYIVMDSEAHGERPVPGVALRGAGGDGRQGRDRDPAPPRRARGAPGARVRLRGTIPQPVHRGRARLRRCRDRPR